jgi:hypothetical protein
VIWAAPTSLAPSPGASDWTLLAAGAGAGTDAGNKEEFQLIKRGMKLPNDAVSQPRLSGDELDVRGLLTGVPVSVANGERMLGIEMSHCNSGRNVLSGEAFTFTLVSYEVSSADLTSVHRQTRSIPAHNHTTDDFILATRISARIEMLIRSTGV